MSNLNQETLIVNQYLTTHKKQFNIEIGNRIKEIRKEGNITQNQLAYQTLMSPTYISQIEKGINGITLNKFIIICNALEIEPNYILDEFLFSTKTHNEIYYELQKDKDLIQNLFKYLKNKK